MANLLANYPYFSQNFSTTSASHAYAHFRSRRTNLIDCRTGFRGSHFQYLSCTSTSSTSSAQQVSGTVETSSINENTNGICDYFVNQHGWRVRKIVEKDDEMRKAANVQAQAFYEPVAFFNHLFFKFFQAEVLSALVYRLRSSPPNRYACLVAEPGSEDFGKQEKIVGVVDVTVSRNKKVLRHLPVGTEEYLFVSGIAVLESFRRQKVATVLLKACDMLSIIWGFKFLALSAYEDDLGARSLYTKAGYRVISADSAWLTTWIGRKRPVLMIKQHSNFHS